MQSAHGDENEAHSPADWAEPSLWTDVGDASELALLLEAVELGGAVRRPRWRRLPKRRSSQDVSPL
jgi:hypothetical protein